jgi:hypothetical protein
VLREDFVAAFGSDLPAVVQCFQGVSTHASRTCVSRSAIAA